MSAYNLASTLHPMGTGVVDVITLTELPGEGVELFNEGTVGMHVRADGVDPIAYAEGTDYVPPGQWIVIPMPRVRGQELRVMVTGRYHLRIV